MLLTGFTTDGFYFSGRGNIFGNHYLNLYYYYYYYFINVRSTFMKCERSELACDLRSKSMRIAEGYCVNIFLRICISWNGLCIGRGNLPQIYLLCLPIIA